MAEAALMIAVVMAVVAVIAYSASRNNPLW